MIKLWSFTCSLVGTEILVCVVIIIDLIVYENKGISSAIFMVSLGLLAVAAAVALVWWGIKKIKPALFASPTQLSTLATYLFKGMLALSGVALAGLIICSTLLEDTGYTNYAIAACMALCTIAYYTLLLRELHAWWHQRNIAAPALAQGELPTKHKAALI